MAIVDFPSGIAILVINICGVHKYGEAQFMHTTRVTFIFQLVLLAAIITLSHTTLVSVGSSCMRCAQKVIENEWDSVHIGRSFTLDILSSLVNYK